MIRWTLAAAVSAAAETTAEAEAAASAVAGTTTAAGAPSAAESAAALTPTPTVSLTEIGSTVAESTTSAVASIPWGRIIGSAVIAGVAFLIWKIISHVYRKYVMRRNEKEGPGKEHTYSYVVYDIIKYIILVITVLGVLQVNGIDVSSVIAGLGVAGVVMGLALQDLLKDVIMGFHIMFDHFFEVGDTIRYGSREGKVLNLNLRTTTIKDLANGDVIAICNRNFSEGAKVQKWTDIDLGLSYDDDFRKINQVLTAVSEEIKGIDGIEDCAYKGVDAFNDSAISYKIRIWCDTEIKYEMRRAALRIIQARLDEAGIGFPYPQMDVHVEKREGI